MEFRKKSTGLRRSLEAKVLNGLSTDILITWNDGITGGEKYNSQPDAKVFADVWEINRLQGGEYNKWN